MAAVGIRAMRAIPTHAVQARVAHTTATTVAALVVQLAARTVTKFVWAVGLVMAAAWTPSTKMPSTPAAQAHVALPIATTVVALAVQLAVISVKRCVCAPQLGNLHPGPKVCGSRQEPPPAEE